MYSKCMLNILIVFYSLNKCNIVLYRMFPLLVKVFILNQNFHKEKMFMHVDAYYTGRTNYFKVFVQFKFKNSIYAFCVVIFYGFIVNKSKKQRWP